MKTETYQNPCRTKPSILGKISFGLSFPYIMTVLLWLLMQPLDPFKNKYVYVFDFIGFCWGIAIILNLAGIVVGVFSLNPKKKSKFTYLGLIFNSICLISVLVLLCNSGD